MPRIIVSRSQKIAAKKSTIIKMLNNFEQFHRFEPWRLVDPAVKYTHSKKKDGIGAWYTWESHFIGSGKMAIKKVFSNHNGLQMVVDFYKPRKSLDNIVSWTLEESGDKFSSSCEVTWSISIPIPFYMILARSLLQRTFDNAIGADFELGLKRLAHLIDSNEPILEIEHQPSATLSDIHYLGVRFYQSLMSEISGKCEEAYPLLEKKLKSKNIKTKDFFIAYSNFNQKTHRADGFVAIQIDAKDSEKIRKLRDKVMEYGVISSQYYIHFTHTGYYDTLDQAWRITSMRALPLQSGAEKSKPALEIYETMPSENTPGVTQIYFPINEDREKDKLG